MKYTNPVIRGFYPDPSICKADGYFYLVCSSFQFFPAIPLFKSKNLVDWEQIGHCITRKSQLDLNNANASGGIFAPTIRYNKGRFYVVVTDTDGEGNFYLYTDDINGEWSEPVKVERGGIDPSLLFDGDKTFFMSNGEDSFGENGISLCEIDIDTGKLLTPAKCICKGTGGRFIEAPHLYHIGEWYYLLAAEGGTEYGHTECMFRSKDPYGPYESCPHNPILTNRNLGGYMIQGAGHADITEDDNGQWWIINLAFRQISMWRQFHHLGREVFLEPIYWTEDGWLKVGTDGTSRIGYEVTEDGCKAFDSAEYPEDKWALDNRNACYIRCPDYNNYRFDGNNVYLLGTSAKLNSKDNVTFVGDRQREFNFTAQTEIDGTTVGESARCGLIAYMNESNHYDLSVTKSSDGCKVTGIINIGGVEIKMGEIFLNSDTISLKISADANCYKLHAKNENGEWQQLAAMESKYISTEVCEGFTGVIIGIFCEDSGNCPEPVKFGICSK